jgi:hypothetical protein
MRSAILLAIACLAATGLIAQTTGGSLRGVVEDSQGARIASADFFGPGTTVGIPFAAQVGVRVTF